jgi:hypothetical protein
MSPTPPTNAMPPHSDEPARVFSVQRGKLEKDLDTLLGLKKRLALVDDTESIDAIEGMEAAARILYSGVVYVFTEAGWVAILDPANLPTQADVPTMRV